MRASIKPRIITTRKGGDAPQSTAASGRLTASSGLRSAATQ
jgi:hypothetical protein